MNKMSMNQSYPVGGGEQSESQDPSQLQQLPDEQQAQSSQPGIGAQLSAQREARGWTTEQVANQLNLAVRQIQALEQDNFSALPGMASVRGFIRAYAKLLKIDAAPLVAMLAAETALPPIEPLHSRRPLTAPFSDARHLPPNGARTSLSKPVVVAIAVGVLLVGALVAYQSGWIQLPSSQPGINAATSAPAAEPEGASMSASVSAEIAAPAQLEKPAAGTPAVAPQGGLGNPVNAQAVAPVVPPAPMPAMPVEPAQPAADKPSTVAKNPLVLKIREDSWLEIRRVGEATKGTTNVLVSRLERAGTTETFDVTEPVVLTVGNAGGVDATLRGEPLDLKSGAKSNVAHLNLK